MTTEDEIRRAAYVLDTQRAQLEALARQQELLELSMEEHLRAKETVSRYRQAGKGTEVIVPVGAGAFLIANVKEDGKALMNIGSDLVVEEKVDNVLERIDARIKDLEEASKGLGERIVDMDSKVRVQTRFVQDLYEKVKKGTSGA